jgi:hypothetical protein
MGTPKIYEKILKYFLPNWIMDGGIRVKILKCLGELCPLSNSLISLYHIHMRQVTLTRQTSRLSRYVLGHTPAGR